MPGEWLLASKYEMTTVKEEELHLSLNMCCLVLCVLPGVTSGEQGAPHLLSSPSLLLLLLWIPLFIILRTHTSTL